MKIQPTILKTLLFFILSYPIVLFAQKTDEVPAYKQNKNYSLQLEMYEIYKTKQADIVMLGNSLTHGANWNELVGRPNIVERGIVSDVTEGMLNRLDHVINLNPKIVFILAGLNDIYQWIPVEQIYANYVRILTQLQAKGITPVIQSTLYAGKRWGADWNITPADNNGRNNEVDKLNRLLKNYAKRLNITYIDLIPKMSRLHFMKEELTHDGLHLNAAGFKIWGNEVEKVLRKKGF
jgi:lysophospholipase L1-like esterase